MGLDSNKFPSFRPIQLDAIEKIHYSDKRFVGGCAPTGTGKEVLAMALARYSGKRTVIMTHTLGLMNQYLESHEAFGLVEISGKDNYQCKNLDGGSCRDGFEADCPYTKHRGCTYETQRAVALSADVVITNYAYWMSVNDKGAGLSKLEVDLETGDFVGGVEQIILDEAHAAINVLDSYLGFRLYERDVNRWVDTVTMGDSVAEWQAAAKLAEEELKAEIRTLKMEVSYLKGFAGKARKLLDQIKHTETLYEKIHRLAWADPPDWVCEKTEGTRYGRIWEFNVIWPGRYAEKYLFCGVPKVVLLSATLRPKTMGLLGLARDSYDFFEWPRQFPPQRNPMYFYPLVKDEKPVRISRSTSRDDLLAWVAHNDDVLDLFIDRRCVVITTSYAYQQFFMENSKHAGYIRGNTQGPESDSAREVFEKFILTPPPIILCSPSFGTGWDFKKKRGELLLIPKVPLKPPAGASKLMAARLERDKEYSNYETMQDVVQWAGRVMREDDDRGTVVITDGSWAWFALRSKHLATKGFVEGVRRVNKIAPMEKL